jgi:hypothetical protein
MPLDRGGVMDARPSTISRAFWISAVAVVLTAFAVQVGADTPQSITVQAQREQEKLRHDLDVFVSTAIVPPLNYGDSLWRWKAEVCPVVAGLNKQLGEYVLFRVSQIARKVGAPLGSETCEPNFYVIVSDDPALLLSKWWKRSPDLFGGEQGAKVKQFLDTPRPIRVWYNADTQGADGNFVTGLLDETSTRARPFNNEFVVNVRPSFLGSRITVSATRNIYSVIVVVDSNKVGGLDLGPLADYIGVIGLAQINLDKQLGDAPTILKLFTAPEETRPTAMTAWDRALLHALYSTRQTERIQTSQMETVALREIESARGH